MLAAKHCLALHISEKCATNKMQCIVLPEVRTSMIISGKGFPYDD